MRKQKERGLVRIQWVRKQKQEQKRQTEEKDCEQHNR